MNGLMNRYRESLKNTPEPVLPSKINGKKIDLSGLIKYAKSKNVYTIFYYVIPKYRNNHYATRAVKLLVDMAFNNKIIVDQLDKKYDYVINRLPLDIRIIYAVIKDMNEYSKNVIMNNNFKISGNFKNIDTDLNNELWDWYLIEKNDYLNQIIS